MTPCLRCGVETLNARLPDGTRITLDAEKTPAGTGAYACWTHRDGLTWTHHARPLDGWDATHAAAYSQHVCQPAGEQLELGSVA